MTKTILFYKARNLLGSSGGIERVLTWQASALAEKGYNVYIATRDTHNGVFFFPLSKKVKFKHFDPTFSNLKHFIGKLFGEKIACCNRELHYSKMIKEYCDEIKPDVIIAAGVKDLQDIIYGDSYPCPKVLQLHSSTDYLLKNNDKKILDVIGKAAVVQVLLKSFVKDVEPYAKGKIVVIGNPVEKNDLQTKREKIIVYAARVTPDKQQHLLIEAFAKIAEKYPDWQVHFYGSTANKKYFAKCQELIERNSLQKQVFFKGVTDKMIEKSSEASICGFVSAHEGFSLALTEAMAAGLPCLGFADSPSVNDLIKDNYNGYLVKDVAELAEKLDVLMGDEKLRVKIGAQGKKYVEQYSSAEILSCWEDVINA